MPHIIDENMKQQQSQEGGRWLSKRISMDATKGINKSDQNLEEDIKVFSLLLKQMINCQAELEYHSALKEKVKCK